MMTNTINDKEKTANAVISISDETFKSEVLESAKPVLVDFWAPWCGPCRMMGPILEELASDFPDSLKIAKINVDENPETATQMRVQAIPLLILFKEGKPMNTIVGVRPKQELTGMIESVV